MDNKQLVIKEQDFLHNNLGLIEKIWHSHQLNADRLIQFTAELQHFSVRLPLVGSFSAGKSSLINFLVKDRLLAANVNPETCLPAEIHYSANERITLNVPGESPAVLHRSDLRERNFSTMPENSWLDIAAPFSALRDMEGITLVDMPGWSSGNDRHSQAIDNYLWRSSAYCLVVSVDEGGLKESLKRIIEEIALNKKPMMLVITKADKKPAEEVANVSTHIQQEIEAITGTPLLSVSIARRADAENFVTALQKLAPLNAQFFHQRVGLAGQSLLSDLLHHLDKLRNINNFTLDEIRDQREQVIQEQQALNQEILQTEQQLRGEMNSVESYIQQEFESRLKNQLESLTSEVLNGGDIKGSVGTALRMAYTTGVENRLKPLIKRKLTHFEKLSAESLSGVNISHSFALNNDSSSLVNSIFTHFLPILLDVLAKTPWLAPVAVIVKTLISSIFNKVEQDMAREQQHERARHYVLHDLIPDCMAKVRPHISKTLQKTTDDIMHSIREEIDRKVAAHQLSLRQLEQQLAAEEAADNDKKARIQQEYAAVNALLQQLKEYGNA